MIVDVEQGVMDYLTANLAIISGGTGETVDITRRRFYEETSPAAVSVYAENGTGEDIPGLIPVTIRITVRTPQGRDAFRLIKNVDALLHLMVRKQFNSEVECLGCQRNTFPQPIDGANRLAHYTCLYDLLIRNTA